MVYSSTSYLLLENGQNPSASVINQSIFWVLSLIAIALLYKMKTDVLKKPAFDHGSHRSFDDFAADCCVFW